MVFIKTPINYNENSADQGNLSISRDIEDRVKMIDNLIELIVFTPRGSFHGDPDFGFEYWNHEYSNVNVRNFNNEQNSFSTKSIYNEITRKECQDSIKRSLETYEVQLKQIDVSIEIHPLRTEQRKTIVSKFQVIVKVTGMLPAGTGTSSVYNKEISFLMEPTVKRINI